MVQVALSTALNVGAVNIILKAMNTKRFGSSSNDRVGWIAAFDVSREHQLIHVKSYDDRYANFSSLRKNYLDQ